jgi:hypothetical protein
VSRLVLLTALVVLVLGAASCARAVKDQVKPEAGPRSSAFDAWAGGNGTGAFFRAIGPAGGTGVR